MSKSSTAQPAGSDLVGRIDWLLAIRTERWLIGVMTWVVVRLSSFPIVAAAVSSPAARGHTLPVAPYRPPVCPPVYLLVRGVLIWTIRGCSSWLDALARLGELATCVVRVDQPLVARSLIAFACRLMSSLLNPLIGSLLVVLAVERVAKSFCVLV